MTTERHHFETPENRWRGMGPYYAMFPAEFCDRVISNYSSRGDTVLDPFAGRCTSVYSAAIAGRRSLAVEINPVGWVYGKTKLNPAELKDVEARVVSIQKFATNYAAEARALPEFFRLCFTSPIRRFLLAARSTLDWRRSRVDRTLMAFLLTHLHGKVSDSFSNQMRQTKAMSPGYAMKWWKTHKSAPPNLDPVEFLGKKLQWRYAKGTPRATAGYLFLGDSVRTLPALRGTLSGYSLSRPALILTSPPYLGVTNYHYDQWLRLWLLGGPPSPLRTVTPYRGNHRGKFDGLKTYELLLRNVFSSAALLARKDAVIYVRTDSRNPTLSITRSVLKTAFPRHKVSERARPVAGKTQTRLFGHGDPLAGEVDLVLQA